MAALPELLTVEAVAKNLGLSTKTVRRRISDGVIAAHRIGRNIRVDAASVTRLLVPINDNGTDCAVPMKENTCELPQLYRQLGHDKYWTTLVDGIEVSTGTADKEEANKRLRILAQSKNHESTAPTTGRQRIGPWSVLEESGRGFIIVYYDENHRRRKHRIPTNLSPAVVTPADADAYAQRWYQLHVAERTLKAVRAVEQEQQPKAESQVPHGPTFREVAQRWTSGKLALEFPDHVKSKRSSHSDEFRLAKYAYDVVGDIPISEFSGRSGLDHVERVISNMSAMNAKLRPVSRRHILQTISRVLSICVYPLRLLERNPLPQGFMPTRGKTPAKVCLFPDEERRLLECRRIPVEWRLLIGILCREGMRLSELLRLQWSDVDLCTGTLTLDKNKTDDPRIWALNPSVVEALSRWKMMLSRDAIKAGRLIVHPKSGRLFNSDGTARRLRRYSRLAGLERSQLYERSEERIPLRVQDLRASFVTISLAQGLTETWVTDRTGHRSASMLKTYRRVARTYEELSVGPLSPLHDCIPELAELANQ